MQNGFSVWTDFFNWIVRENFMLVGRNLKRAGYNVNVEASDCKRVLNLTQNIWILDPCLFGFTKLNPFFNINLELQFYPKFLHSPIPRKTSSLKYAYHSRRTIFSLFLQIDVQRSMTHYSCFIRHTLNNTNPINLSGQGFKLISLNLIFLLSQFTKQFVQQKK